MDTTIKYFTQGELKRLFKTIENSNDRHALRNLCIFRIAYRCGLRASEIGLIRLENYNKSKGELYCKRLKGSWNNTIAVNDKIKYTKNERIKYTT